MISRFQKIFTALLLVAIAAGVIYAQDASAPLLKYDIVNVYPHDPGAYTQGLVYADGYLIEGTGLEGRSSLRLVDLKTGLVEHFRQLPSEVFGEGVALWGNEIIQLTWKNFVGYVYNRTDMNLLKEFFYTTEGWGLTQDGERLIMSDGSATLYFLDPASFEVQSSVQVTDAGQPVTGLNELEWVDGQVLANIWPTDRIARIDPASGRVTGWLDLSGILGPREAYYTVDVLNGIAYDPAGKRLFITGKLWPKLFEIRLQETD